MAVVESGVAADSGAVVQPTSQDSDDQNHQSSRIEVGEEEGLYSKIGSHPGRSEGSDGGESYKREMRELQELFSKLNPMAAEFVPPSLSKQPNAAFFSNNAFPAAGNAPLEVNAYGHDTAGFRRKKSFGQGKRRMNARTSMAQRDDVIRRTVYVSDLDQQVTEEQLAGLFVNCGQVCLSLSKRKKKKKTQIIGFVCVNCVFGYKQVVDCRICGDPNSVLRFAFIEFTDEEGAMTALNLSGTMLGFYPVKVLPSKTAIAPVNPTFLPRTEDEREMCARTIYCTNIDKKVTQSDVKIFFESFCGEVLRLRLLGDYQHSTRIAFVEFVMAESAIAALNCSGVVLGSLPIRVSPSKTPVRPRSPRHPMH
ncbi:polyadenylate-binding protein-interacting protein 11 isoform X1 [Brassica napus]|uniref:polyadenylate-binding protein-interacting protein 11 isoform X1 n=1 Tax=Brassica napus TaxID=3708 RepID=UPI0020789E60|nr:polyadenylate-binding protein-interacting protein 11 isoform X1 [Brassica napus]